MDDVWLRRYDGGKDLPFRTPYRQLTQACLSLRKVFQMSDVEIERKGLKFWVAAGFRTA